MSADRPTRPTKPRDSRPGLPYQQKEAPMRKTISTILAIVALTLGVTATATASSGTDQQSSRSVRFA